MMGLLMTAELHYIERAHLFMRQGIAGCAPLFVQ